MSFDPHFHEASRSVRFWVPCGDSGTGASIGQETLSYCFLGGRLIDEDPLKIYLAHQERIHAAVIRRVSAGSREPVMLRPNDFIGH